jgi:hypothetical protein
MPNLLIILLVANTLIYVIPDSYTDIYICPGKLLRARTPDIANGKSSNAASIHTCSQK